MGYIVCVKARDGRKRRVNEKQRQMARGEDTGVGKKRVQFKEKGELTPICYTDWKALMVILRDYEVIAAKACKSSKIKGGRIRRGRAEIRPVC